MNELHPVKSQILYMLRHVESARFSRLMRESMLESDSFKFHVRALVKQGYIEKLPDGSYGLTLPGKEYANNLDEIGRQELKQPKLSLLMVASRVNTHNQKEYLVQQRLRQPFYGYWGCLSGPVQWGEDFAETVKQELEKQCGVIAVSCTVVSFYRQKDYAKETAQLLEDKLFVVVDCAAQDAPTNVWKGGVNKWMTLAELEDQEMRFHTSIKVLQLLEAADSLPAFISDESTHSLANY